MQLKKSLLIWGWYYIALEKLIEKLSWEEHQERKDWWVASWLTHVIFVVFVIKDEVSFGY